jgi:uncharacterized protein HemX
MGGVIDKGIETLATQGIGWLLAVLLGGAVVWLFHRLQTEQSACNEAREALHEKRLTEARQTLDALHAVAKAQGDLAESITARTETLKSIADYVAKIERDMGRSYDHWQGRVAGMEKALQENRAYLEKIERGDRR